MRLSLTGWRRFLASAVLVIPFLIGCKKQAAETGIAQTPEQAATQLEQAFAGANDTVKQAASAASEAMVKGDYEKAVVSLQVARGSEGVTLDQGLAIHSSAVMLEERLIRAIQAGDKNAERSYQLLKAMKAK